MGRLRARYFLLLINYEYDYVCSTVVTELDNKKNIFCNYFESLKGFVLKCFNVFIDSHLRTFFHSETLSHSFL